MGIWEYLQDYLLKIFKSAVIVINFNMKHFKKYRSKGSCMCNIHTILVNDEHIKSTLNDLCDYIRENYDMEDIV